MKQRIDNDKEKRECEEEKQKKGDQMKKTKHNKRKNVRDKTIHEIKKKKIFFTERREKK